MIAWTANLRTQSWCQGRLAAAKRSRPLTPAVRPNTNVQAITAETMARFNGCYGAACCICSRQLVALKRCRPPHRCVWLLRCCRRPAIEIARGGWRTAVFDTKRLGLARGSCLDRGRADLKPDGYWRIPDRTAAGHVTKHAIIRRASGRSARRSGGSHDRG